ncbi:MAG TPA: AAA family ATPase [Acidobacteriaceae bacterium]|jgi:predicted ATPase|nr:AAA family ATPase [Acidobacteriaceae bacterium]
MKPYILTGTSGAGKTAILRQLEADGYSIVEEAATDIIALEQAKGIAEPWTHPAFLDTIATLQKQRQLRALHQAGELQFHDRSAICTAALAAYLGFPITAALAQELKRIQSQRIYEQQVFFIRNMGFMTPSEARKITFEESLRFEQIHEETYRSFGYEIINIASGKLADRAQAILAAVQNLSS